MEKATIKAIQKSPASPSVEDPRLVARSYHLDRIESAPDVMMGKPVIAGTRIPVESVLEKLAGGESVEDVLEAHPHLERADVEAALAYALAVLRMDVSKLIPGSE